MTGVFHQDINRQLETYRPRSVLLVDRDRNEALRAYQAQHPRCRVTRLDGTDPLRHLQSEGRYDMGIVVNTLEHMDKAGAGRLVARLRDLHTRRACIVIPVGPAWCGLTSTWEPTDMIAYGMTLIGSRERDGKPVHLYGFDIAEYKERPDWLNSDHWANPDLWDKYRW